MNDMDLTNLIKKGDLESAFATLIKIPYEERRKLSKCAIKQFKETVEYRYAFDMEESEKKRLQIQEQIATVSVYATATLSEIKKLGWKIRPDYELAEQILQIFKPAWVNDWVDWLLDINPYNFELVRKLYLSGFCNKPENENYILGMILRLGQGHRQDISLIESLRSSKELLEEDLWRIFCVEGNGEYSLAANDKYTSTSGSWSETLVELSNSGEISRDRLLDASLDALDQDFAQFRAGWFSRFHEALSPTVEERVERVHRYLHLLGSQIPPTVTFALKALTAINKKEDLPVSSFMEHVLPAIEARTKSTVTLALKILESLAKSNPEQANELAGIAAYGLIHEGADVQKRVLDMLDKYGIPSDEEIIRIVNLNAQAIVPSLKKRLSSWVCDTQVESRVEVSEVSEEPGSDLQPLNFIVPINTLDELIERFSYVLENPDDPIEIEKVLDGIARLKHLQTDNFAKLVGPLKKRATTLLKRGPEKWLTYNLATLALSYVTGKNQFVEADNYHYSHPGSAAIAKVYSNHLMYIADIIESGKDSPLLSMPTHGRAFISPYELIVRYKQLQKMGAEPPISEQVLSLLRLDITEELDNKAQLVSLSGEFAEALRFALGEDVPVGNTSALWMAAACVRCPNTLCPEVFERFGDQGPNSGQGAKYSFWVEEKSSKEYTWHYLKLDCTPAAPASIPSDHLTVLFHTKGESYFYNAVCGEDEGVVRWASTIWPSNLESYFYNGASVIDITWSEAQWHVRTYFEPMLEPDVPLNEMALLLLSNGLGAKEPGQKGIATDIVIMGIDDGRLDIGKLAECMGALLPTGYITVARWTKALQDISTVSNKHAKAVRTLIQGMLRHDPADSPRDLGGLIELLYELQVAAEEPLSDPVSINYLARNKKGGKLGKFSKRLLDMLENES